MQDEDPTTHATNGTDISEEQVIAQQMVPFMGDDLAAALAPDGHIYITLPGIYSAGGKTATGVSVVESTQSNLGSRFDQPTDVQGSNDYVKRG